MKKLELPKQEIIGKLTHLQIFTSLSEEETGELFGCCDFSQFDAGEKIISQDEMSTFLCGILEGNVKILTVGEDGREIKLGRVGKGDIVGETSVLMDLKRTADVVAEDHVEIVIISRDKLLSFVNKFPKAGVKIFAFIIFSLVHKLKSINREMVFEKESSVTAQDLERLKEYFKPVVDDFIS